MKPQGFVQAILLLLVCGIREQRTNERAGEDIGNPVAISIGLAADLLLAHRHQAVKICFVVVLEL